MNFLEISNFMKLIKGNIKHILIGKHRIIVKFTLEFNNLNLTIDIPTLENPNIEGSHFVYNRIFKDCELTDMGNAVTQFLLKRIYSEVNDKLQCWGK